MLTHQPATNFLIERSPVGADADGFVVFAGNIEYLRKLGIMPQSESDVAGIDSVLVQRTSTRRGISKQGVGDEVIIPDKGHMAAFIIEALSNLRHSFCVLEVLDGDPHEFAARSVQCEDLLYG